MIDKPRIKLIKGVYFCQQIFSRHGVRIIGTGETPKDAYLSFLNECLKYFNRRKINKS